MREILFESIFLFFKQNISHTKKKSVINQVDFFETQQNP